MTSVSFPAVPMTTSWSAASPRSTAISISGTFVSEVAPGPSSPPERSSAIVSVVPIVPLSWIVSVFAVVAAPQAIGTAPKRICPAAPTRRPAWPPEGIVAVTDFAAALKAHGPVG